MGSGGGGSGKGGALSNPFTNPMDWLDPAGHLHTVKAGPTAGHRNKLTTGEALYTSADPLGSGATTLKAAKGKDDFITIPGSVGRDITGENLRKDQAKLDAKKQKQYDELRKRGYRVVEPGDEDYDEFGSLLGE